MKRWIAGLALVAPAALWSGCPCDAGALVAMQDGFDERCGDLPCGWSVESGEATVVSTFHSAELGVRLGPSGRIQRPVEADLLFDPRSTTIQISLSTRCESGGQVRVIVAGEGREASWTLPPTYEPVVLASSSGSPAVDPADFPPEAFRVETLAIENVGTSPCDVDDLLLFYDPTRCHG